jgi:hypothetical protein
MAPFLGAARTRSGYCRESSNNVIGCITLWLRLAPFKVERASSVECGYNLLKFKTQDFVCFKVKEQLNRIINVDNVLLVADDYAYVPYLRELQNRGVEVIVFQNSEHFGSRMYHEFKWADIIYPLALSMGYD